MAYDEVLADRVTDAVAGEQGITERKMFGGLCVMLNGHMVAGVIREELMVRVGKEGFVDDLDLRAWVERGLAHARLLPPK
jgi:TfoX/Sxy family transcriptional regulator of competence genes